MAEVHTGALVDLVQARGDSAELAEPYAELQAKLLQAVGQTVLVVVKTGYDFWRDDWNRWVGASESKATSFRQGVLTAVEPVIDEASNTWYLTTDRYAETNSHSSRWIGPGKLMIVEGILPVEDALKGAEPGDTSTLGRYGFAPARRDLLVGDLGDGDGMQRRRDYKNTRVLLGEEINEAGYKEKSKALEEQLARLF